MKNITSKLVGKKLILEIDLSDDAIAAAEPSATGKTRLVASTRGAKEAPGVAGVTFSVNVMVKRS